MNGRVLATGAVCVSLCVFSLSACAPGGVDGEQAQAAEPAPAPAAPPGTGFAAVPGLKGGQDVFGPYNPVAGWPKPLAESVPDHEGWTWSQATDVFVESPDRILVAQKGELPVLPDRIETHWLPDIGPGIKYPVGGRVPLRESSSATPSYGRANPDGSDGRPGIDWRWHHVIVVFDHEGNMTEDWTQWDSIWGRPHDIEISPYDPEKNIWIVDADAHFVSKFSNDGKQRLLTLGTPGEPGNDDTHFRRPTFIAFMDRNTFYLADGYDNTRVIKYDMDGNKLLEWGMKGNPPNETRPGYFNSVHGIAVNPLTRRVYINDRNNGRVQVFDENGNFLDQWSMGPRPPMNIHSIYMGRDGILWAADQGSSKLNGYTPDGQFIYSWGTFGDCQGCMWGVHGFTTDMDGNLFTAEVRTGRVQMYTPREGANPTFLVGKPWPRVW